MSKFLAVFFVVALFPVLTQADGVYEPIPRSGREAALGAKPAQVISASSCVSKSQPRKIELISYNSHQKAGTILGAIQECHSTMFDVLRLLSGPNFIGLKYPEEKEQWGYLWLWTYKLQNPIEETVILMDEPGKRIQKGKNPVELYITFNEHDVVEQIEMDLLKKKGNQYVVSH